MSSMTHDQRPVIRGTQHCPNCGLPSESTTTHRESTDRPVWIAYSICGGSHMWMIKWADQ